MKYLKVYFLILISISFSGCIQSTALLGPGFTIATTGNVMHAGLQYGANKAIEKRNRKRCYYSLKRCCRGGTR
jgi:hypothetical protein